MKRFLIAVVAVAILGGVATVGTIDSYAGSDNVIVAPRVSLSASKLIESSYHLAVMTQHSPVEVDKSVALFVVQRDTIPDSMTVAAILNYARRYAHKGQVTPLTVQSTVTGCFGRHADQRVDAALQRSHPLRC